MNELSNKYGLPFHEVHVEALTNIVWWMAGRAEKMFERHYNARWKELVDLEKEYWKVVGKWWEEGGDLAKQIRAEFM